MPKNNQKRAGRPRHNDTGSPVISDRAKLRRLKDVVCELMEDYEFTTHTLAKYTIGEKRSSYISSMLCSTVLASARTARPPTSTPRMSPGTGSEYTMRK